MQPNMNCPRLGELPSPPLGKTGWPWRKQCKPLPLAARNGNAWPKITIVTPSYNQGQFLEEAIRSVLLQGYPNLEYMIMDGGSSDNSVEIIKKYEPWLTYWVSERDRGQADAIYRGFEKATGEIIAWINSDDYYLEDAFAAIASLFVKRGDAELVVGGHLAVNEHSMLMQKYPNLNQDFESLLLWGQRIPQGGCFWLRKIFFEVGGFDRNLVFAFDYDMLLRFTKRKEPCACKRFIAAHRLHGSTKTNTISQTAGRAEEEKLRQLHAEGTNWNKNKMKIVRRAELRYALNQLRMVEYVLLKPQTYINSLRNSMVCMIRNFPFAFQR